jgi:hypothetical protein
LHKGVKRLSGITSPPPKPGQNKEPYNLRNYMTIRAYAQVIAKEFQVRP